ncbi:hypothetical protein CDO73_09080 [Saccharibacillus sp. O23]|uniref:ABC1 kinase family protein n=1 Tax=Saccharibacillus sp. O23 TaxID=2009338 RepID=UPI000B4E2C1C|nr:AarF/UbiB family protein [Saccharibacillus sp. O23]OWR30738.1 hypothetical protein CDO73_09080 [Saccharibacillus sp. O23]
MFFFIILAISFGVFLALASFLRIKHKFIVSAFSALAVSMLIQFLEQFYLSAILIVAFVFYFFIGSIKTFKSEQIKLMAAVLLSASIVTLILSFTYFDQPAAPPDDEVLRVMFVYYPLLIVFASCYAYMLLSVFNFRILQSSNPFGYVANKIRGFRRMFRLLRIASRKGLNPLIRQDHARLPYAIAEVLESMGGVFVKFAQVLSTKKDMLPANYIEAFSSLHDQVKPLGQEELQAIINAKIGNLDETYASFEMKPLAAASIGQVHLATLKSTGEKVVVKILRPDVKQKMTVDLDLLIQFVTGLSERSSKIRKLGLIELAEGFKANLIEETDFDIEALNTNLLKQAFRQHGIAIRVPKVYSEYSTKQILTLEYIEGTSFNREVTPEVSEKVMHAFLDQILVIGIFHADPHPGNLILTADGEVALIDFGSVGYLSEEEKGGMLAFLVGYSSGNTKEMTRGLIAVCEDGELLDERALEQQLGRLLSEASFSHDPTAVMMKRLVAMIADQGLSLRPTVAGAFRSILTLDGTLSAADPTYSLSASSQSYAQRMDKSRLIMERIDQTRQRIEDYLPRLLELPLLKENKIVIAREESSGLSDFSGTLTIGLFTVICMVVMLTGFFVQSELMHFLLGPLSLAGFGTGMIMLMTSVVKQLKLRS